ncbi:MAG: SCO family protein [Desulforhopalus sp.]
MKTRQLIGLWWLVVSFVLTSLVSGTSVEATSKAPYKRSIENYTIPDLTLLNQDGQKVRLKSILDPDKPLIIDFIFTTCTTICPVLSANFLNMQKKLGDATEKVQLLSISIDPEYDRPERMQKYLHMFGAKEGWDFLTGSRDDIFKVLQAFDASIVDKMSHIPLYILRAPKSDKWVRINGLIGSADLMSELGGLQQ